MKFDLLTLRPIDVSEAKPRDVLDLALKKLRSSDKWVSEGLPRRDVLAEVDPDFINHAEHLDKMISGGTRPDGSSFRGAGGIKSVELDVSEATADVTIKGSLEWDKRPHTYTTRIQFQNFKLISGLAEHTWSERARVLLGDNIRVDCDCAAFRYFHRHAATTKGFALIPESRPARVRNPANRGGVCKHLEHALKYIGGSYTTLASAMKLSAKRGGLVEDTDPDHFVVSPHDGTRHPAEKVDGELHHTHNSEGRLIHPTPEGRANFHRWFKGSKVTDEHGRPKVVYHGTRSPENFHTFGTGSHFDDEGEHVISGALDPTAHVGAHFAEEPKIASNFAHGTAAKWDTQRAVGAGHAGGRVKPVYLSVKSPHHTSDTDFQLSAYKHGHSRTLDDHLDMVHGEEGGGPSSPKELMDFHVKHVSDDASEYGSSDAESVAAELGHTLQHHLKSLGHDGVRYNNEVEGGHAWVAFHPHQIKSATGNAGTFSPHSDHIGESALLVRLTGGGLSESGEHALYYHGGRITGPLKTDTYITDDADAAREYAHDGTIHKVSANFRNPLRIKDAGHLRRMLPKELADKHEGTHYTFEMLDDRKVRDHLRTKGHDAVHFTDQTPKTYKDHSATLVLDPSSAHVTESVLSRLTQRLEEARGPRVLYRAQDHSGTSYDETKTKDFGIHAGTEKAARERAGALGSHTQIHKVHVSVHNPIRMKDNGAWSSADIATHLHRTGKMSTRKLYKIGRQDEPTAREMVTRHLEALGHDGIVYRNKVEGKGTDSVIALRGPQVKHVGVV